MPAWLLALALAAPPVTLPPEHPGQAMRPRAEAEGCAADLLDAIVRSTCADGRCRPTPRLTTHVRGALEAWCRAGYRPKQIRRAAAQQREALATAPPPGPPLPDVALVAFDSGEAWVRPATPMVMASCGVVAGALVAQGVPAMQAIRKAHPDTPMVCVAPQRDAAAARKAMAPAGVPVVVEPSMRWQSEVGEGVYPFYALVTADGHVADLLVGDLDTDRVGQFLAAEALE